MKVSVSVKGIDKVNALLKKAQWGSKGLVARVVAEYIVGDRGEAFHGENSHGLRHYAPWKKVTRKSAYGVTFFSDKQRRAFFAKLRSGDIGVPYTRTGKQGKAWKITGQSTNIRISNNDRSVKFTRGQTRLHARMGWQTVKETIQSNIKGALRAGKKALMDYIRSR